MSKLFVSEINENIDLSGRQRQLKKDEAIRKKLELDFLKKPNNGTFKTLSTKRMPVSALRPGQALTVRENMIVIEAAQLMAAKRCDCVLVINGLDQLCGIFTAKDLAYRLVAENLDAKETLVIDVMTKNPLCVTSDTSATEALNLMVSRGFRHLPVCNENGDIFGLLDITKCLYSALEKMERASATLYDALQGLEKELELTNYMETLREKMSSPNLESVVDSTPPLQVKYNTNVQEIAVLMRELNKTAVLVTKRHQVAGIFTSKDIVLRVIAAGLKPENCTVVRVMTPNPDTVSPETTVLDALKKMNEGHYLNLPIMDKGIIISMVDVLKLTYVTLEQMGSMTVKENEADGSGPLWGRFWEALDTDYLHTNQISSMITPQPQPSSSLSQLKGYSDILPNESASMVNMSTTTTTTTTTTITSPNEDTFTFKFTPEGQKTTHRIVCKPTYAELLEAIQSKISSENLVLSYLDDEKDEVLLSCDMDVLDAVRLALKENQNRVKLIVQEKKLENHVKKVEPAPIAVILEPKSKTKPKRPTSLLLPAAVSFLGVVVTGVIVVSKLQKKSFAI